MYHLILSILNKGLFVTNYFKDCKNQDDVKRLYRELAKKLHPDHGGSHKEMIELTKQYDEMIIYGPTDNKFNRFERTSTFSESEKDEHFRKGQEQYHKQYGGYGGYRYANQGSMFNEFKQQSNDPRIADYERMRKEHTHMAREYGKMFIQQFAFELEIQKLKKKITLLEKKLKKPTKPKKDGKCSPSICL